MDTLPPLILLAAGQSSRTGEPKGLIRVGNKPWLEVQLESFRSVGGRRILVVLGFHAERYLAECSLGDAHVVINPAPQRGPFSSLQSAVRALLLSDRPPTTGAYVLPLDVPCPSEAVWRALLVPCGTLANQPRYQGRGGHPIFFSARWLPVLAGLACDSRLDELLRELKPTELGQVEVSDPGIRTNLNTLELWKDFLNRANPL